MANSVTYDRTTISLHWITLPAADAGAVNVLAKVTHYGLYLLATAALFHRYVLWDRVLGRMMPAQGRLKAAESRAESCRRRTRI